MIRSLRAFMIPDEQAAQYFALPDEGAVFVHANYDYARCTLIAVFEHESYYPTPPGMEVERAPMPIPDRSVPEQPIAWLARLLGLGEDQARDWAVAKIAAFRGISEEDVALLLEK